jgi:hypothetical protein
MTCETKWALRYQHRIVPNVTSDILLGGTLIHAAIAHYYAEKLINAGSPPPTWWTGESLREVLAREGAGHPYLIRSALEVYQAYGARWQDEPITPIAVEEEFEATVGELDPNGQDETLNTEAITCKVDLLARRNLTNDLVVIDHKTKFSDFKTGKLPVWDQATNEFTISWQAIINLLILRARFPHEKVIGFSVNRVTRRTPYEFDRSPCLEIGTLMYRRSGGIVRAAVRREREIQAKMGRGELPDLSPWMCVQGKYNRCDYVGLCSTHASGEAELIVDQHFKRLA